MRRLTPLWIFILIFVAGAIYLPGLSKYLKLKRRDIQLYRELEQLKAKIVQLHGEEHLLKTDLTKLEEAVREELGLAHPAGLGHRLLPLLGARLRVPRCRARGRQSWMLVKSAVS